MASLGMVENMKGCVLLATILHTLSDTARYFNSAKHSDVTIELDGKNIKAHKLVLSQGSDYFKACFEGGWKVRASTILHCEH